MLRAVFKYGLILGSLAFILQVLQRGLDLEAGQLYPSVTLMAALFVILGFLLGHSWHDRSSEVVRTQLLFNRLTEREKEVARLILAGCSNKEIQQELHVEKSTLKTHINQIYRKGEIENRKQFRQLFKLD